jgi:hypothetical protein
MLVYDPDFDLAALHAESAEIFQEFFNAYLRGDLKYLEFFVGEQALAVVKTEI